MPKQYLQLSNFSGGLNTKFDARDIEDNEIFIDHIEYIIKLIGIDYVAIGSDYDGLDCLPKSWNDCLDHMIIAEQLEIRGYSNLEIEKIMGKNILRVLEEISFN